MATQNKLREVAIIMRTKDRNIFLERALNSVFAQTFIDYVLVIVNDGGSAKKLDELVNRYKPSIKGDVNVIHNNKSLGKWHAANQGIKGSKSTYIVLHDDDDSWEPGFLKRTVEFLNSAANSEYAGVATLSNLIKENVKGDDIELLSSTHFAPELGHVSIYELCRHNIFPPIAYLYRRAVHKEVGYYNEGLPALADWVFNLRAIQKYDIAMLHERLANWHQRNTIKGKGSVLNNVTAPDSSSYQENISLLINSLLREDLRKGQIGIGYLVNLLYNNREEETAKRHHFDKRTDDLVSAVRNNRAAIDVLEKELANINQPLNTLYHRPKRWTKKIVGLPKSIINKSHSQIQKKVR